MQSGMGAARRAFDLGRSPRPQSWQRPHVGRMDRADRLGWAHVDVPDLDLMLPYNAAELDHDTHDVANQAAATWKRVVCWHDNTPSGGWVRFQLSEPDANCRCRPHD